MINVNGVHKFLSMFFRKWTLFGRFFIRFPRDFLSNAPTKARPNKMYFLRYHKKIDKLILTSQR